MSDLTKEGRVRLSKSSRMRRRLLLLACAAVSLLGSMPSASAVDAIDDWNQAGRVDSMTFSWLANGAGSTRQVGEPDAAERCTDFYDYAGMRTGGTVWFRADPLITHDRKQLSGRFTVKEQDRWWMIAVFVGPSPDTAGFLDCATNVSTLRFQGSRYGYYIADPTKTYWFQLTTPGEATMEIEYNCASTQTNVIFGKPNRGECTQAPG